MKGLVFSLALLASSLSFAQVSGSGRIVIGNGQSTIGISVGAGNPNQAQLIQRVLLLEQAVRDLQVQVYNLSVTDVQVQPEFECRMSAFGEVFFGKGTTEAMAKSNALKNCVAKNHEMHCKSPKCDQLQ